MRDFLCFEKHLLQAFRAIGKTPPQAWYERPIFYHPSRFSVCGPDAEVPWPGYTERLCSDAGGYVSGATIDVNGGWYFGP